MSTDNHSEPEQRATDEVRVGDVVVLRVKGAPDMIVRRIEGDEAVCEWFDGKKPLSRSYPLELLRGHPETPPTPAELAQALLALFNKQDPTASDR